MVWTYEEPGKFVNTYVVNELGQRLYIPDITANIFPGMTEVTLLEETRAEGWTASFGCGVEPFPYTAPDGWMCDPSVSEVQGRMGSHGGCSNCIMIHLGVKVKPEFEQDLLNILYPPKVSPLVLIGLVGASLYAVMKLIKS